MANKLWHGSVEILADLADRLKRAANDFTTFTAKTLPVGADVALIEDSAASWAKKKVALSDWPLGDIRTILVCEHWLSGNLDVDEIGGYGWRFITSGGGSSLSLTGLAGHPGIVNLNAGTAGAGMAAIHLGITGDSTVNFVIGGTSNIEAEFLIRLGGSIGSADLELIQVGLGTTWETAGPLTRGVVVRFNPTTDTYFTLVSTGSAGTTTSAGTTVPVINTWYRVGFVISDPGGTPSIQMKINGVNQGSAITTNIPTDTMGFGHKVDSNGGGTGPQLLIDYSLLKQPTDGED